MIARYSKVACTLAIGFFAFLVVVGNVTDYWTNYYFVENVLKMTTVFPDTTIRYREIDSTTMHHVAYIVIIFFEALTFLLCTIGGIRLLQSIKEPAEIFNKRKNIAILGLTVGFLVWQVGFMSVGGEWFGMWMSQKWNGIESAFRFFVTIILVLIYLVQKDAEL